MLGKITGMRRVPFNTSDRDADGRAGTYQVGRTGRAEAGRQADSSGSATLAITKCAGIIVITRRTGARVDAVRRRNDPQRHARRDRVLPGLEFTDPAKAPVANVSPGIDHERRDADHDRRDVARPTRGPISRRCCRRSSAAGPPSPGRMLLMSETNAAGAGTVAQTDAGDAACSPGPAPQGGSAMGVTFISRKSLGSNVVAAAPAAVSVADDGGINIDVSREASVQMDSAPMIRRRHGLMTSFWQNNLIGLARRTVYQLEKVARARSSTRSRPMRPER